MTIIIVHSSGVGIIGIIVPDLRNSRERRLQLEQIRNSVKIVLHHFDVIYAETWQMKVVGLKFG